MHIECSRNVRTNGQQSKKQWMMRKPRKRTLAEGSTGAPARCRMRRVFEPRSSARLPSNESWTVGRIKKGLWVAWGARALGRPDAVRRPPRMTVRSVEGGAQCG